MPDSVIFSCVKGQFVQMHEARLPNNRNFVITWRDMDWSGFRTLAECRSQFRELEETPNCDLFAVVER